MSTSSEDLATYSSASSAEGDVYSDYPVYGVKRWKPHSLPEGLNIDGKHVWEPPIFAYNELIDEKEYEKQREAALKYTKGDRAKATEILNIDIEWDTLIMYKDWLEENVNDAGGNRRF